MTTFSDDASNDDERSTPLLSQAPKPGLDGRPTLKPQHSLKAIALTIMSTRRLLKAKKQLKRKEKWRYASFVSMEDGEERKRNLQDILETLELEDEDESQDGLSSKPREEEEKLSTSKWLFKAIFKQNVSFLLLFLPFAWLSHHLQWNPTLVFWLNFLAMVPLATILGEFTEELALHTNQTIGGLINATFGNAVEAVVAIQALLSNQIRVVQASMLGSIFSNLLLVLGSCFFFGGIKYPQQKFNSTAATANMSLLGLASIAFILPTPFAAYNDIEDEQVLVVSRFAAVFLFFMYICLLIFQLKTHANLFEDDEDEETSLSFSVALIGLTAVTVMITFLSDWLVESIDGFVEESGISKTFVGIILLPIVGNAVEHITAVTMATKNKMDLSMAIAIGSCVQIALFVTPLTVLVGWASGKDMTLNFPPYELMLFVMSVVVVAIAMGSSSSNWLLGALLVIQYVMIGVGFWYEQVDDYN